LPQALAVDLEPPIDRLQRYLSMGRSGRTQPQPQRRQPAASPQGATAELSALTLEARAHGLTVLAAVVPLVAIPDEAAARGWQRLLQTPVDGIDFDCVSTMAYTSLLQGYSRGALRRADARALLARLARDAHVRYGNKSSVSLGAVGQGALGDERVYRCPDELVEDVGIARAAGPGHLALFNLDGALARPPLATWLDALVKTPPASLPPPSTLRARLLYRLMCAAGRLGQGL
jgi:hypothetical protein